MFVDYSFGVCYDIVSKAKSRKKEADGMTVREEMAIFCANLKHLREKEGLTHKEMAACLGIGVETLKRLERGEIPPRVSVEVIFRASTVFGLHPKELFRPPMKDERKA